ncbi:MAG: peptidase [Betaproteobacteria bacterium]|nr:MAG: peptidase [Betaproteobacteria bacterium]
MRFHLSSLAKNLLAGLRLALFLPVRAFDYRVSGLDYVLLVLFDFVVWVAVAAALAGFEGDFNLSAIPMYLASISLVLGAALLVALAYGAAQKLLSVAVALGASEPWFELVVLVVPTVSAASGLGEVVLWIVVGWTWIISVRAIAVVMGPRRPQLYQGALLVGAVIAIAFFAFPETDVWLPPNAQDEEAGAGLIDERAFHLQGQLIERALAELQRGRPGVPELYFVGFAPDGSQDVFLREMRHVKQLFDERFGTAGRSIALASSRDALEEFPIGSVTNLARALHRVGEAMNPDEDALFLFLSAHGDREHRLSASQPPLELAALTPTALARILQDSGIKWRVIVVSACYSGGYVEPLRDDNTVVIAASAPDRTSFGCEAGREFTYFGQAYFRDALAQTRSFTDAFEIAKELVAKQESEEGLQPSRPQIWVGPQIAERLKKLADRPNQ